MLRAAVQRLWVPRDRLGTFSRPKWSSSWGSGFDGSSFSDEEDCPYDEARRMRFGYGEPGSVTLKGNEVDFMVDEFNKVWFSLSLCPCVPCYRCFTSGEGISRASSLVQFRVRVVVMCCLDSDGADSTKVMIW
jgi:hypothetical protein